MRLSWIFVVFGFALFTCMDVITVLITRYAIGTRRFIEKNPLSSILFQHIGYAFTAVLGLVLVISLFFLVRRYFDSYFGNRSSSFAFLVFVILIKLQDLGMDLHAVYGTWWF